MTDKKKKRMSMLDNLANATAPAPQASMMSSNRALRSARDAVDNHHVWELDPAAIDDGRLADRLDPSDVLDLLDAIEANGQTVPILVRRDPSDSDKYLLVYGRRRLEAIRLSDKVTKVRALVTSLDDDAALRAQISENMARRDLSYIEKALFSQMLMENDFGTQSQVAEVLTVTKSAISMGLSIVESVGRPLAAAIGAAHSIGRPRWEALAKAIDESGANHDRLIEAAEDIYAKADVALVTDGDVTSADKLSIAAFDAVTKAVQRPAKRRAATQTKTVRSRTLNIDGRPTGTLRRTDKGLRIDLENGPFADWFETEAQQLVEDLHARWIKRSED